MGGYINTTGKIFGGAVAAWVATKIGTSLYEKHRQRQVPEKVVEEMPDRIHHLLVESAQDDDQETFSAALDNWGFPQDFNMRSRMWDYYGGS